MLIKVRNEGDQDQGVSSGQTLDITQRQSQEYILMDWMTEVKQRSQSGDFPGGPVVKIPHFQ